MEKKVVLLTGCSSGIGEAAATYFAENGWSVAATMRKPDLSALGDIEGIKVYQLDVTNQQTISKCVSDVIKDFGRIDCLVNNAGYGLVGPFETLTESQLQRQYDTNVFGLMNVTRTVLPELRRNKDGVLINISSVVGRIAVPNMSAYVSTKWAVEGFTESLIPEVQKFGVRVRIVEPGPITTKFNKGSMVFGEKKLAEYQVSGTDGDEKVGFSSPPEEVARVIFKAANSYSARFRYPAGKMAGTILLLRKVLPEGLWNILLRKFG